MISKKSASANAAAKLRKDRKTVHYNGEDVFIADLAKSIGISVTGLEKRILTGMTIEQAVSRPKQPRVPFRGVRKSPKSSKIIEHNGVGHTIKEWSNLTGIASHTIVTRLRRGWTTEQAVTAVVGRGRT